MTTTDFIHSVYTCLELPGAHGIEEMRTVTKDRHNPEAEVIVGLLYVYGKVQIGTLASLKLQFPRAAVTHGVQSYGDRDNLQTRIVIRVGF